MKNKSPFDYLLTIVFALATVWWAIYEDFNGQITSVLKSHGFNSPAISSFIAGLVITLLATIAVFLYDNFLWKIFFRSSYRGGWWLYGLVDDESDPKKPEEIGAHPIVGFFQIEHSSNKMKIKKAKCFYFDSSNKDNHIEKDRGAWNSNIMMNTDDLIRLVYEMENPKIPSNRISFLPNRPYMGFMQLINKNGIEEAMFGKNPHHGTIVQVSLEHDDHGGVMYCECLKPHFLHHWTPKDLKQELHRTGPELVEKAIAYRDSKSRSKEI